MDTGASPSRIKTEDSQASFASHTHQTAPRRSLKTALIAMVFLLVALLVLGILPRIRRKSELSALANHPEQAVPVVQTIKPHKAGATTDLVLPATTQAIRETMIFARTRGYVRAWYAGMGQQVKAGQLLAEITAPEADQELREGKQQVAEADQNIAQARADLARAEADRQQTEATIKQARSNLALARVNLDRSKKLVGDGILSQQDLDDKQAAFEARQADLEAAEASLRARQSAVKAQQSTIDARQSSSSARQANVQKLADVKGFQRIIAPYDGTITARNVELGTLINESGGTPAGTGLFRIGRLDTIRVFVNVPQTFVGEMHAGLPVTVEVKDLGQRSFTGAVFGTAHVVDPASRTMMVEIRLPNPDGQLIPGVYAQVRFKLATAKQALLVPAAALVVNADGTQLLVVRPDGSVHYQKVEVGQELGKEVEIASGLDEAAVIVVNPSDSLREGMKVQTAGK